MLLPRDKNRVVVETNYFIVFVISPLNAKLNPILHLLASLRSHHILHVSGIKVNCSVSLNR
jgi:hypothetical protein